jgi:hypothetical protein
MTIKEKVEGYLIKLDLSYQEIDENSWLIIDESKGLENVIIMLAEPLVLIHVKVMSIPTGKKEAFYEKLLRLNSEDLIHGAYALQDDSVIILDTLEDQTLDLEEFQASLDAIGLALSQHYPILSEYRTNG